MKKIANPDILTLLLILVLNFSTGGYGFSQPVPSYAEVISAYEQSYLAYPRQKVFLHTDKDTYHVHETLWFKAYIVDAFRHKPDTLSSNLYVQLLDSEGKHIRSQLLRLHDGLAHGQLNFPDSLPDGNYVLRAFTNWMHNFSDDFFFSRHIYIHNPEQANYITRSAQRSNRRFNRDLEQLTSSMQFAIFPEGGNWVYGLPSRVAFKAADGLGRGVDVNGRITDQTGREIASFSTFYDGMGSFSMTPEHGYTYQAEVNFEQGGYQTYPLPMPKSHGYAMAVSQTSEGLDVLVYKNFDPARYNMSHDAFILAHSGGSPLYMKQITEPADQLSFSISDELLPTGVTHITLFDGHGEPAAERLVFINHDDIGRVSIDPYISHEQDTTILSLDLFFDTRSGVKSEGSFSMAILSAEYAEDYTQSDIASYFLLTADIAATISNPAYYIQSGDKDVKKAADLLMMTHGWRRFSWEHLLAGQTPDIRYGFARGLSVRGSVRALSSAEAAEGVGVEMIVGEDTRNRYTTKTDKEGHFVFTGLDYDGSFRVRLSTPDQTNGRNLWIDLAPASYPEVPYVPNHNTRIMSLTERGENWQRKRPPFTWLRAHQRSKPQLADPYFGRPDQVIYAHDIQGHYNHMIELLMGRVLGLTIEGGNLTFRGQSSFLMDNEPLYVVDGIMVHKSTFMAVQPSDLERLEVLRGSSSAIFGSRGGNGVLLAFTKKGDETSRRTFEFSLGGYHEPREFYLSRIESEIYEQTRMARTIFWTPELDLETDKINSLHIPVEGGAEEIMVVIEGLTNKGMPVYSRIFIK